MICVHCVVSGKVQGVFYRQSTMRMAQAFGLTGKVRNLDSGDVEVFACGEESDVEKLTNWLKQGPVTAEVSEVKVTEIPLQTFDDFIVDY